MFFEKKMESWVKDLVKSQNNKVYSPRGDLLPEFPPEKLQIATTGRAGEDTIRQAVNFYEDAVDGIAKAGEKIGKDWKLLDFGSGWGRITRVALRHFKMKNMVGVDVDGEFVALSNRLFSEAIFKVCEPFPPTQVAPDSLDLILAYSVFSHLSEDAAIAWLNEFHRILAPGRFVAITTRALSFIDYCERLAASKDGIVDKVYQDKLAVLFPLGEAQRCKETYNAGSFIFKGIGGGGVRDSSFYGEAFIPAQWIEREFKGRFKVVSAIHQPERYDQLCFVLRKERRQSR